MSSQEDDNWDDLRSLSLGPTPVFTPLSTESNSGEFNPFSYVGQAVNSSSKRTLFVFESDSSRRCFGPVGASNKFCLKECTRGGSSCGSAVKHETNKFQPEEQTAYIKFNDTQALMFPCLSLRSFSNEQRKRIAAKRLNMVEWERLFEEAAENDLPSWLLPDEAEAAKPEKDTKLGIRTDLEVEDVPPLVLSPIQSDHLVGIFKVPPVINIFTAAHSEDDDSASKEQDPIELLKAHAVDVETKWTSTFNEVESSYMILVDDIRRLYETSQSIHKRIGSPDKRGHFTLNDSINEIHSRLNVYDDSHQKALMKLADIANTCEAGRSETEMAIGAVNQVKRELQEILTRVGIAEERLVAYGNRFENIKPVLNRVRDVILSPEHAASGIDAGALEQRFTTLRLKIERIDKQVSAISENDWDNLNRPSSQQSRNIEALLRDTNARIKQLEQRIVGEGVSLGNTVFQSFDELKTWVVAELPKFRYGLFVDAGGLLDMFSCIGYTDFEKTTASMSNIQKTGFATMHEARLTASMQNVLPTIFGKPSAEGLDSSQFLPAISDPDKWDDGTTGIYHQIARAMIDVEFQLDSTINSVYEEFPAARQLAKDCLYQSKRFVTDLTNFVSNETKAWIQRGHSKKEAWRIQCVCVRRIFEELHSARVIARDIRDATDPAFTAAKIIWAVLKAHAVMSSYVKHRFKEHPSIAAVIACHLAANFHKTDDGLQAKVTLLESKLKSLTARLDRFEAKADSPGGGKKGGKKGGKEGEDQKP